MHTRTHTRAHTHTHTHSTLPINSEMLAFKMKAKMTEQAERSKTLYLSVKKKGTQHHISYWSTKSLRTQRTPPPVQGVWRSTGGQGRRWRWRGGGGGFDSKHQTEGSLTSNLGRKSFLPPSALLFHCSGPKGYLLPPSPPGVECRKVPNLVPVGGAYSSPS